MFILGAISILQMALLPGFLFTYGFRLCNDPLRLVVCTFCLSALFNFFIVHICLLFGILLPVCVYILFILELFVLAYLTYSRGFFKNFVQQTAATSQKPNTFGLQLLVPSDFVGFLAIMILILTASEIVLRMGDTFTTPDALASWNRWGQEIAQNSWATYTLGYPQLIPSNYALNYLFMQNSEIWFFSKFWISNFFFVLLLSIYQLYQNEKRWEIALAVPMTFIIFYQITTSKHIYDGTVDVALATFAFNTVVTLLNAGKTSDLSVRSRELLLGALFAIGSALTKQGGLFMLIAYPLLTYFLVIKPNTCIDKSRVFKLAVILSAGTLMAVIPWYIPDIFNKQTITSTLIFDIHKGRGLWERLGHAWHLIEMRTFPGELILLILFVSLSLVVKRYRLITLLVAFPYALFWALGFSYDKRNIALSLPFFGLSAAMGMGTIWSSLKAIAVKILGVSESKFKPIALISIGLGLMVALNYWLDYHTLQRQHTRDIVNTAGVVPLNHHLAEYFREDRPSGKILTSYKNLLWIPHFRYRLYVNVAYQPPKIPDWSKLIVPYHLKDLNWFLQMFKNEEIRFVLFDRVAMPGVLKQYLDIGVKTGEFKKIFTVWKRFIFYEKLTPPKPETLELTNREIANPERGTQ